MRATVVSISDSGSHPRSHFVHCRLMRQRRAAPAEQPAEAWETSRAGGVGATLPAVRIGTCPLRVVACAGGGRKRAAEHSWLAARHFQKASPQFSRGHRGLLGVSHASGLSRGAAPRGEQKSVHKDRLALVADHVARGRIVFPGAGYLELGPAATRGSRLEGVFFLQPLLALQINS